MSESLAEFMADFQPEDGKRLDDGTSWRKAYVVEFSDVEGFEGEYVVKTAGGDGSGLDDGTARTQNRREVRAYLESLARDQQFIPDIVGFSEDYQIVVMEQVNPLSTPDPGTSVRSNPQRRRKIENYHKVRENLLPEDWDDEDHPEIGMRENGYVLLDAGRASRDDWKVEDPTDCDFVEVYEVAGDRYHVVDV